MQNQMYAPRRFVDIEERDRFLNDMIRSTSEATEVGDKEKLVYDVISFTKSITRNPAGFRLFAINNDYWEGDTGKWLHITSPVYPVIKIIEKDRANYSKFVHKNETHLQLLYSMWYTSDGVKGNVKRQNVDALLPITPLQLKLLCHLLIPDNLIEQLSPTYAARFYTLITGSVITVKDDPTFDPTNWNRIVGTIPADQILDVGKAISKVYIKERIADRYSNAYSLLFELRLANILDKFITKCELQTEISKSNFGTLVIKLYPKIREFFTSLGSSFEFYDDPDMTNAMRPVGPVLDTVFTGLLRYHIRLALGIGDFREPLLLENMQNIYEDNIDDVVQKYSDLEWQQFFLPFFFEDRENFIRNDVKPAGATVFTTRGNLIYQTLGDYEPDGFVWKESNPDTCSNDDKLDVASGSLRGETRKEDAADGSLLKDPNIMYTPKVMGARRRCFRLSELTSAFQQTAHGFEYLDPDWIPPDLVKDPSDSINPLTGKQLERIFPTYTVVQLFSFLRTRLRERDVENSPDLSMAYSNLLEKVKIGIKEHTSVGAFLKQQQDLVNQHPEWRNDLLIYFGWLFLFAMWIRFWKGPGTPYPTKWVEYTDNTCEYQQRDQHINIELSVHGNLIGVLEHKNPELATYLKTLPFMYYGWTTGEINKPAEEISRRLLKAYTVEDVIDRIQMDRFCMAQGSDILSGTAFIYLTEILNVPRDRLSDVLLQTMKLLHQYERFSIDNRSRLVSTSSMEQRDKMLSLEVIEQHRAILNVVDSGSGFGFVQPPLDISGITETKHLPQGFGELVTME